MNKTDLSDVTFLIPIRLDTIERLENVIMVSDFLLKHFNTNIYVVESANYNNGLLQNSLNARIHCKYIYDDSTKFHRTRILNEETINIKTPFLAIWDSDVIIHKDQINASVACLRTNEVQFVYPYDGRFLYTDSILRLLFLRKKKIRVLAMNKDKMTYYNRNAVGGGFIVNREAYIKAGMENENFCSWGPEDFEREKRWEILNYTIRKIRGPLYHLYHPRKENSWYFDNETKKRLLMEFLKICQMNKMELQSYIKSFTWTSNILEKR